MSPRKKSPPIERVTLENFQSIADLEIRPDRTTAIIGPSDVGKSAIVRAFYALITQGNLTPLRRTGASQCSLTLRANGTSVTYDEGGYEGTSGKEPISSKEEAQEALQLPEIVIDRDITFIPNVKLPLTPPFLVVDPPAYAAKVLASVSGIHIVLAAQREAQRRLGNLFKDRAAFERHQAKLEEGLKDLVAAPERHRKAADLKEDLGDLMAMEERREGLQKSYDAFMEHFTVARKAQDRLERLQKIGSPELGELPDLWDRLEGIRTGALEIDDADRAIRKAEQRLKKATSAEEAAVEALKAVIKKGRPCPYTSYPLPKECSEALAE